MFLSIVVNADKTTSGDTIFVSRVLWEVLDHPENFDARSRDFRVEFLANPRIFPIARIIIYLIPKTEKNKGAIR